MTDGKAEKASADAKRKGALQGGSVGKTIWRLVAMLPFTHHLLAEAGQGQPLSVPIPYQNILEELRPSCRRLPSQCLRLSTSLPVS